MNYNMFMTKSQCQPKPVYNTQIVCSLNTEIVTSLFENRLYRMILSSKTWFLKDLISETTLKYRSFT